MIPFILCLEKGKTRYSDCQGVGVGNEVEKKKKHKAVSVNDGNALDLDGGGWLYDSMNLSNSWNSVPKRVRSTVKFLKVTLVQLFSGSYTRSLHCEYPSQSLHSKALLSWKNLEENYVAVSITVCCREIITG